MSTSKTALPATHNISTLLLALKRLDLTSPKKVVPHLRDPDNHRDLHYLDALATLCSFAGPCESVSTAIRYPDEGEGNNLYIATSPAPPPPLQAQVAAWVDLLKTLPLLSRASSESDSESEEDSESKVEKSKVEKSEVEKSEVEKSEVEDPSIKSFIIAIYRDCHRKLLDIINRDNLGERVLEQAEMTIESHLSAFDISRPEMLAEIKSLVAMGQKKLLTSPEDLLSLYRTAKAAIRFENPISQPRYSLFFQAMSDLTLAVDNLVSFATRDESRYVVESPWNIIWVPVPESGGRDLVATANVDELAGMFAGKWRKVLPNLKWEAFEPDPSGNVRQVEGCPAHFSVKRVVHCESALLGYMRHNQLFDDVEPYIGCSQPACYACLMLIRAHQFVLNTKIEVGPRSSNLREIDISWAYQSDMGNDVYKRLVMDIVRDFRLLSTNPYEVEYNHIVPSPDCLPGEESD